MTGARPHSTLLFNDRGGGGCGCYMVFILLSLLVCIVCCISELQLVGWSIQWLVHLFVFLSKSVFWLTGN